MKQINPADLIPMDVFLKNEPILIDLVYADATHPRNIFDAAIYRPAARLWAHKDIAAITILTARILNDAHGYKLEIKDCLRPADAQATMQETDVVKANPEWMTGEFPLLSKPGARGHPRAMAIDVCVINKEGHEVDMGVPFDFLGDEAARNYLNFSDEILSNRTTLEDAFMKSAEIFKMDFLALPCEWWDFRFPASYTDEFAYLSDEDLPPQMQMTNTVENNIPDFSEAHFETLADSICALVDKHHENI